MVCVTKQIVPLQASQLADVAVSVFALFSEIKWQMVYSTQNQ